MALQNFPMQADLIGTFHGSKNDERGQKTQTNIKNTGQ